MRLRTIIKARNVTKRCSGEEIQPEVISFIVEYRLLLAFYTLTYFLLHQLQIS